jgi:hypothetical protein
MGFAVGSAVLVVFGPAVWQAGERDRAEDNEHDREHREHRRKDRPVDEEM